MYADRELSNRTTESVMQLNESEGLITIRSCCDAEIRACLSSLIKNEQLPFAGQTTVILKAKWTFGEKKL